VKTAIYIEDGVVQLVLTPQNEFEKNALMSLENQALKATIMAGSFYKCRGGWNRQSSDDHSLILRHENPFNETISE
jgi:hypothetical protein